MNSRRRTPKMNGLRVAFYSTVSVKQSLVFESCDVIWRKYSHQTERTLQYNTLKYTCYDYKDLISSGYQCFPPCKNNLKRPKVRILSFDRDEQLEFFELVGWTVE